MRSYAVVFGAVLFLALAFAAQRSFSFSGGETRPLPGLSAAQADAFDQGLDDFEQIESYETGLGPAFNGRSCQECHSVGGTGGASPNLSGSVVFHIARITNGRFDPMESFGGSVLQRRSVKEEKQSLTVLGEAVPKEATIVGKRQTPPLFGAGLIDAIRDDAILSHADPNDANHDGISGRVNLVYNPEMQRTQIGRFGWKADIPTLHLFAGLAYVNELGITNPSFPKENLPQGKAIQPGWDAIPGLEDDGGDTTNLFNFMRLLAPLSRRLTNATSVRGEKVFAVLGCANCHTPSLLAGDAPTRALSGKPVPLFSDLLIHDMGSGLADGIVSEQASGSEFRTSPLWGLSRRRFFLHDGRALTIQDAITAHGGEATMARHNYQDVNAADRIALLYFLETL